MEDVKIGRAMLLCLALLFMISLGLGAASASDLNDFTDMDSGSDLELSNLGLSDSVGSVDDNQNYDHVNVDSNELNAGVNEVNSDVNEIFGDVSEVNSDVNEQYDVEEDSNYENINNDLISDSNGNIQSNSLNDGSNTIYVSPNGNDENDGLSRENPVGNISRAVSIAGEGDSIFLLNGVYNQDAPILLSKNLYFIGENGAIINRTANLVVFRYTSENIKTISFKNIVFVSQSSTANNPILSMAGRANLICDNCTFTHIISNKNGVVRFMGNSTGTIFNCNFIDLDGTTNGGASYVYVLGEARVKVDNCIFKNISNSFLRAVVYVNNDLANLTLSNSHFYNISGNANAIVENRGYMQIYNSTFNDISLSGNSPVGIIWTSETITKNSRTYINSSSFYNNSISTSVAVNSSIIQGKSPIVVEYSSFLNNDVDFIVNNDNKTNITANHNWWGTNSNPRDLVSDDVTIDNWFIMSIDFDADDLIAGEEYPITVNINQITDDEGQSYYLENGIYGAEIVISSQNGRFIVNEGIDFNGVPAGGGTLEEDGKIARVYTANGAVNLIYAPVLDGSEIISFKSGSQEFIYNIVLAEAIAYEDYYVSKSGNDENDGLTEGTAFKTIAHAIETAKNLKVNAKIHIFSGTYEESGFEIIAYGEGFGNPHFAFIGYGNVVIDGKGQGKSIFTIRDGAVSFKNIRFTNVNGADNGGAINVALDDENEAIGNDLGNLNSLFVNLTINNCIFDNLSVNGNGGAICYNYGSGKIIINNTKFYNLTSKTNGGAIYIKESADLANLKITASKFRDNIANNGGALYLEINNITIGNCDFANNSANGTAGAISFLNSNALIENCTITNSSSKRDAHAILIDNDNDEIVAIKNSAIENNSCIDGDGIDEEIPAIYLIGGKLDISYSSIVNDLSLATADEVDKARQVIVNNNWWGTNEPEETIKGSDISIDQWLIMHVSLNNTGVLKVGNTVNVTIDFNHVMTSSGEILPLTGGKISREFAVRMNATAGRIYPYYVVTRDREASSIFTVQDGGACLDIRTENALIHLDFIVNNYFGVIYISNNGNDDWNGSIESPVRTYQKAISLAMEEGGSHHIFFLQGTYELYDLNIDETYLTIEGEGIDKSILDGVQFTGGMISNYESELIIKNITLRNGANTISSGGTITNMGNLTLDTVRISDSIVKNGNGGAIYSVGVLNIRNSSFVNNLVDNKGSGGNGGAIYIDGYYTSLSYPPTLNITDCEFISNTAKGTNFGGGAIYMQYVDGFKSIVNTKFIRNQALYGGAIFLQDSEGNFIMDNVSFIGNKATGSSSSNPYYGGGALNLIGQTDHRVGNIIITNSLFENNSAKNTRGGGAIFDRNVDLNVTNSVIFNNTDNVKNIQVYKDTTVYLPGGGSISLEDNWWGMNDLSALSTAPSNVTIKRWVVMELIIALGNESNSDSNPLLNEYMVFISLDHYSDGTLISDNGNYERYSDYPFERKFKLSSSTGSFNPNSALLLNNVGGSVFTSDIKDNTIIATIDNQSLQLSTRDFYINTTIGLELESNNIVGSYTTLNISLNDIDSNPINGSVILSINGREETVDIINGKAIAEIKNLRKGTNNITVRFNGSGYYWESENSCLIEVSQINVNLSIVADDAIVGESSNVRLFLYDEFNHPLSLMVNLYANLKYYPVWIEDGKGSILIDPFDLAGAYPVTASFDSDEYEGNKSCEALLTVYGVGNVTVKHSDDGDALDIQRAIDSASPGDIIQLGNYSYANVSNINITKDLTIAGNEGTSISSKGDGEAIFNAISKSENGPNALNITGIAFKLNNGDVVLYAFAQNYTFNSLVIDTQAISITENSFDVINDDVVPESIEILHLKSERGILNPNNEMRIADNTITAGINPFKFDVAGVVSGGDAIITPQNISLVKMGTIIEYHDMETVAVDTVTDGRAGEYFIIALKDIEGNPLEGKLVQIGFNGNIYNRTSDENGSARLQINLGTVNWYTFAVSFLGDDCYEASFVVAKINVVAQKGSLTVPNKSYKASEKTKTLTATFKSASGKAVKGKKVTFTVNGKTYTATTNAKGVATVNVSLNKKGTYSFTVKFAGDKTYAAMTKTAKLVIK